MRKYWLGICLFLTLASLAQAQQWSGQYSPYSYGHRYYGYPQQAQATRYYNPYGYQAAPTYYAAPRYNYSPDYAAPGSATASDTIVEVQPQGSPIRKTGQGDMRMLPATTVPLIVESDRGNPSRFRTTSQVIEPGFPQGPPSGEPDRGNVALFWDKMVAAMDNGGPDLAPRRPCNDYMWVSANYLASFIRPMRLNAPLLTGGSVNDPFPGSLGQPTTVVLFGADPVNFNLSSGASVAVGAFIDGGRRVSVDAKAFGIFPERQSYTFVSDSAGNPLLARPYYSLDENRQASYFVSVPVASEGGTRFDFTSRLFGGELNGRYHGCLGNSFRYDLLLGARYAQVAESLTTQDNYIGINGILVPFNGRGVNSIYREDSFSTKNHFFGGQLGGSISWEQRWLSVTGFAKLGLGATVQRATVDGSTTANSIAGTEFAAGGILALPTNMGTYSRTRFSVLPEFGINCGLNVTDHVRLQLGYSGLLWNGVARPGTLYNTTQNSGLAPSAINFGPNNAPIGPGFRFTDELFWTHTMNLGLEFHF